MKKRYFLVGFVALIAAGVGATAYVISPTVHPGQSGEAPELGRTGDYHVGTIESEFPLENRTRITAMSAITGDLDAADRRLSVRIWYPAQSAPEGEPAQYTHQMNLPGKEPFAIVSRGIAYPGATPLTGEKFPLVLMSHGYGGWNTQFSNLGEHIASRGYVVASIDHADVLGDGVASAILSFGNVLVDRTLDQRQIMAQIISAADNASSGYHALVDPERVGLLGYSMGGYGAIASAGAPYSFESDLMSNIPEAAKQQLQEATRDSLPIQALIAISPWGGQPDTRAWSADSISKVDIPTLIISGNQDDVVNFDEGVSWLFNNMTGTNRHMLVYREARHNIVGNDFDVGEDTPFAALEFLKEPVWRSDRMNAINQHFVTAFLDWRLKGEEGKATFLNVPTVRSNEGEWETSFGEQLNGKLSGTEETGYWRGFQRRWAAGLEMHRAEAGQ